MSVFICKMCGGTLDYSEGTTVCVCNTNYQLNTLIIHCLAVILWIVLAYNDLIVAHKRSTTLFNV